MSRLLAIVGAALVLFGAVLLYARQELLDPSGLSARAASALDDDSVRRAIAPTVAGAIADAAPANAPSDAEVATALADPRVKAAFGSAAGLAAEQVAGGSDDAVGLDLAATTATAVRVSEGVSPDQLGVSASDFDSARIDLVEAPVLLDALDAAQRAGALGLVLVPVGLALLLVAVLIARDRLRALAAASLALAIAAGLLLAALYVGREVVVAQFDAELVRDAVSGGWSAAFGPLRMGAIAVAVGGVVAAVVATALASRTRYAY